MRRHDESDVRSGDGGSGRRAAANTTKGAAEASDVLGEGGTTEQHGACRSGFTGKAGWLRSGDSTAPRMALFTAQCHRV
jgi:hypothetical protein